MSTPTTILIQSPGWKTSWKTARADIRRAVRATFAHEHLPMESLAIVLMDDATIQALNKTYRKKNKPTNVLSFVGDDEESLGDILLAYETIRREAKEQHKLFTRHAIHLVIHGTLHLLGYDHEKQVEANKMEAKEIAILDTLGIANPYRLT
jgi:probable rRNA maturation factor